MRISDWSSDVCSSDLRIDVGERYARIGEHALDQRREAVDMRARGDLRYHAAIGPVLGFLPRDAVRADAPLAVDKRRRGFVAARFEAEDQSHDMALPYPRGACGSKQGLGSEERRVGKAGVRRG